MCRTRAWLLAALFAALAGSLGCGDGMAEPPPNDPCAVQAGRLVVTADWLNRSLTLLSHARLLAGCPAETAIEGRIDLSAHAPGPLQVEITPDGRSAVVSLSAGFFEGDGGVLVGSPDVPPGGGLLVVDLVEGVVVHAIDTAQVPMGIAISPDGRTAFSANFGRRDAPGNTLSVIDLEAGVELASVTVGALPEQVALSEDGSFGIVNLAGEDSLRTFLTADPAGTLSAPVATAADPSDVVVVGDRAVVVNSAGFSYGLVDVSDPSAPAAIETVQLPAAIPYAVSRVPGSDRIAITGHLGSTKLHLVDLAAAPTTVATTHDVPSGAFPIGVAIDPDGGHAFIAHPTDHQLSVVDLETGELHAVAWLSEPGPTYVAVQR
jgi:DNA-binding beta-propeller fold protein YncE